MKMIFTVLLGIGVFVFQSVGLAAAEVKAVAYSQFAASNAKPSYYYQHSNRVKGSAKKQSKKYRSTSKRYASSPRSSKRVTKKKVTYRSVSMPSKRPATGRKVFIFNPRTLSWGAYNAQGRLVRSGRASGGRGYCPDVKRACRTPSGTFHIISKRGAGCRSSRYPLGKGGAPMPYCMFFSKYYAIHGSPDVPNYNASHGCVRVLPSAAKWLSHNFITTGTTVIVRSY